MYMEEPIPAWNGWDYSPTLTWIPSKEKKMEDSCASGAQRAESRKEGQSDLADVCMRLVR